MALTAANWPDQLDPRITEWFDGEYEQTKDMIPMFFSVKGPGAGAQKSDLRGSSSGALTDPSEFIGQVTYQDVYEGYDWIITPREYTLGLQIQRKLWDDALTDQIKQKAAGFGRAVARFRQKHAASIFTGHTSVDTTWLSHTEGVAMVSNTHTTRAAGVSTAAGFDNLTTAALSTTAVIAARIQMKGFRDDRGNRIENEGDTLIVPVDSEHLAFEISQSQGIPELATNARNFNEGRYKVLSSIYFTDTNDWWMADMAALKRSLTWFERIGYEVANVESFDELIGKWRAYMRWGLGWVDWRPILGGAVS